jgi:hypothetical protein
VLQAWRERFVRDNGREPVVWLDRACLNPALGSAQLPALPVYCAACDKLVALRGPTYLNRLVRAHALARTHARPQRSRIARVPSLADARSQPRARHALRGGALALWSCACLA